MKLPIFRNVSKVGGAKMQNINVSLPHKEKDNPFLNYILKEHFAICKIYYFKRDPPPKKILSLKSHILDCN